MTLTEEVKRKVKSYPCDFVFTARDVGIVSNAANTQVQILNRLVKSGMLSKLSKGRFYKPRQTQFGPLGLPAIQVIKEYIERDGKTIGYLTGCSVYNELGLTTQISSNIQIGTNKYRQKFAKEGYNVSFVVQQNVITSKNKRILQILDSMRFVREIPGTTPDSACLRLKKIVRGMDSVQRRMLVRCALNYTNYVRALCGAILEDVECDAELYRPLRMSLNQVTDYELPISRNVLPTKLNWNIYDASRK